MDTSKVYFKNLTSSEDELLLIIQGSNSSTGPFTNCNYNRSAEELDDPYLVPKDSVGRYYSSTVYEIYHNSSPYYPQARLRAKGVSGSYYTIWSPDNYHGY